MLLHYLLLYLSSATLTTSLLSGEANTTASFLFSAIVIKLSMCVASPSAAMIRLTSTFQRLEISDKQLISAAVVVAAEPSEPFDNDTLLTAVTSVNVIPDNCCTPVCS